VFPTIMSSDNPGANMAAAVEAEIAIFRGLQEEIGKMRGDIQTLLGQQNENEMVKQELELLDDSASTTVYKLVGPVLMKNELDDAKQTVEKRLEFIGGERKKLELALAAKEEKARKAATKVQELQGAMQRAAVEAARAVAADASLP
jgi:prefoldin beta subunit